MLEDFSIGKILLILLLVLIFFGPKKIPDIAQSIGKGIREFKKAMSDMSDELTKPANEQPKAAPAKAVGSSSAQDTKTETNQTSELK